MVFWGFLNFLKLFLSGFHVFCNFLKVSQCFLKVFFKLCVCGVILGWRSCVCDGWSERNCSAMTFWCSWGFPLFPQSISLEPWTDVSRNVWIMTSANERMSASMSSNSLDVMWLRNAPYHHIERQRHTDEKTTNTLDHINVSRNPLDVRSPWEMSTLTWDLWEGDV